MTNVYVIIDNNFHVDVFLTEAVRNEMIVRMRHVWMKNLPEGVIMMEKLTGSRHGLWFRGRL
jgi:hypothetical protein